MKVFGRQSKARDFGRAVADGYQRHPVIVTTPEADAGNFTQRHIENVLHAKVAEGVVGGHGPGVPERQSRTNPARTNTPAIPMRCLHTFSDSGKKEAASRYRGVPPLAAFFENRPRGVSCSSRTRMLSPSLSRTEETLGDRQASPVLEFLGCR